MPTSDEIREYQEWCARFINAVWDAEARGVTLSSGTVDVEGTFGEIGGKDLPKQTKSRLVNDLVGDGLLEGSGMHFGTTYPPGVTLTSFGRREVERWITADQPTAYLPLRPSQVFTTHFHGDVTGASIVQGASDTTVNMQTAVGEPLANLVEKANELLSSWNQVGDEREEVEADIEILADSKAPSGRLKAAARRVGSWAAGVAATGTATGIADEVHQLAGTVIQSL